MKCLKKVIQGKMINWPELCCQQYKTNTGQEHYQEVLEHALLH